MHLHISFLVVVMISIIQCIGCHWPAVVLRTPLLYISLISPVIGQKVSWHVMNLDARCLVQHLQVFKDYLADLVQITGVGSNSQCR